MAIPALGWFPFPAEDIGCLRVDDVARGVEGMNGHIDKQHMVHVLAESAEMRCDEEIAMDAGWLAKRSGVEKAPDAPRIGEVAAILHDGVQALGSVRQTDDFLRVRKACGHRLFGKHVTAVEKAVRTRLRRTWGRATSKTMVGFVWARTEESSAPTTAPSRLNSWRGHARAQYPRRQDQRSPPGQFWPRLPAMPCSWHRSPQVRRSA